MKTTGNTVLITGGGSGIGLALARAFAAEANRVIVVGRNAETLSAATTQVPGLHAVQADITREDDCRRLLSVVGEQFPELNVLVNNAGVAFFCDLRSPTDPFESIRQEIETNYLAPVRLTQRLLPGLLRQSAAAVINVTSPGVYLPLAVMPGYSASKAALSSYTRSLRLQLAGSLVKVYEVVPSPVDTGMVAAFHLPKMPPERLATQVLKGLRKDHLEILVGNAGLLRWLARLVPGLAERSAHAATLRAVQSR